MPNAEGLLLREEPIPFRLTRYKRLILGRLAYYEGNTFSTAAACLSEELGIDLSTVRRSLRLFRDSGLILAGSREKQFVPLSLTPIGKLAVERFTKDFGGDEMDGSEN